MHAYRTHSCGQLRAEHVGNNVRLSGWVHRKRDLGGLLFIDLRDHYGITQCVVTPSNAHFAKLERIRVESVITLTGEVVARDPGTVNAALATGEIDLKVKELTVISESEELPLPVFAEPEYPEDVRLKYRFLDLRRETLHANIVTRTKVIASMRKRMHETGFTEYSTPILTASSPEGARDFLVPSRIHQGKFFALPQAPQQYKQLLMVAGFDRYFQIAPCFRDEDPRADRLPGEFYQLDLEMSFVTQEDVWDTMEPVLRGVFEEFGNGKPVTQKFPRIPYDTSIRKYGSDKPDIRNPIEMDNVSDHFRGSGFKVFAGMLEKDAKNEVWGIPAPGGGSRAFCDKMNSWAQQLGQPGLGYIFWREGEEGGAGPVAKNIGPERTEAIRQQFGLKVGDAVFFTAGDPKAFYKFAGEARNRVGTELNLTQPDQFACCWIVDFPFYEWSEEEKKVDFAHNPFSMPQGGLEALNSGVDPLSLKAFQYDMVCNGYEIASGSIRNASPDTMVRAFEITGLTKEDVETQFGGMYRAFQFGAPPHGGMAAGVDRIVMLVCGVQNLREITLFPMNQQAQDLLMGAPSEAAMKQLRELGIRVVADKK
ncbi:MAG: aspartate--tRNA ligase [Rhodobacterales bacterium 12-64-8]|nr:MAG: aspartate--tRNA ligase [Rhodobacterales bacterium 12-64-8]OYX49209.1 MAG: aspartate--tRNA ligase [Alphaproteobacteria bacterium 32-64-14]